MTLEDVENSLNDTHIYLKNSFQNLYWKFERKSTEKSYALVLLSNVLVLLSVTWNISAFWAIYFPLDITEDVPAYIRLASGVIFS